MPSLDLGIARLDDRRARRCWASRPSRSCGATRRRAARRAPVRVACAVLEGARLRGPGAQPARAAPDRLAAPARGPTPSSSWPTTARACSSATTSDRPPAATGSATCSPKDSAWKTRLGQDFDVRSYVFDSHLRAVDGFDALTFDGTGILALDLALGAREAVPRPAAGRRPARSPTATATDVGDVDWSQLPPIYPVVAPVAGRRQGHRRAPASRSARPTSSRPPSSSGPTSPPSASRASRSSPPSPTRPARTSSARRRRRPATASR